MVGQAGRRLTMLHCEMCHGKAIAGLAHMHGLTQHLCPSCTKIVLDRKKNVFSMKEARQRMRNKAA
jgi:hypothetical protein